MSDLEDELRTKTGYSLMTCEALLTAVVELGWSVVKFSPGVSDDEWAELADWVWLPEMTP